MIYYYYFRITSGPPGHAASIIMPSLARVTTDSSQVTESPIMVKKLKKEHVPVQNGHNAQNGHNTQCQLVWSVKNRKDYNPPTLRQPYGISINPDSILTTEGLWPHSRVQIFNHNGRSRKVIGQGQVLPFGVTTNSEGQVVVTDHRDKTVKAFTVDGHPAWSWEEKKFVWPNGIAQTAAGQYVVTDWSRGCVCICDAEGNTVLKFPTVDRGSEGSRISCPDYVCVDQYGRIILSDAYDQSVKVFNNEGHFLFKIGHQAGPGRLEQPKGVATDAKNGIIVADWGTSCIKMFSANGSWMKDLTEPECLRHPLAIDICDNKLVVTEHKLNSSPSMKMFNIN